MLVALATKGKEEKKVTKNSIMAAPRNYRKNCKPPATHLQRPEEKNHNFLGSGSHKRTTNGCQKNRPKIKKNGKTWGQGKNKGKELKRVGRGGKGRRARLNIAQKIAANEKERCQERPLRTTGGENTIKLQQKKRTKKRINADRGTS